MGSSLSLGSSLGSTSHGGGWVKWVWAKDSCSCVGSLSRKGPDGHPLNRTGLPQVNEVVFSPSESHCATCGEDGSVRVWSLASMELVIQFQVLNQVGGEIWGDRSCALLPVTVLGRCWFSLPPGCGTRAASASRGRPSPVDSRSSSRWWQATAMAHFESSASLVPHWNSRCTPTGAP